MLLQIYILFQILVVIFFCIAFFTHQEIFWAIMAVLSAVLIFGSTQIEYYVFTTNYPVLHIHYSTYLMWLNIIFFSVGLFYMMFDMFDKYGSRISDRRRF